MGRSQFSIYEEHYPYFISSTARGGLPLFSIPVIADILLDNLIYLQVQRDVTLYGYVVMENHFHAVVQGIHLSEKLRLTKSYMARCIVDTLIMLNKSRHLEDVRFRKLRHKYRSDYQIWEEGFHPVQISTDELMSSKLDYIHFNPVVRGYVDHPVHWRYSSARNYAGEKGVIPVTLYSG